MLFGGKIVWTSWRHVANTTEQSVQGDDAALKTICSLLHCERMTRIVLRHDMKTGPVLCHLETVLE